MPKDNQITYTVKKLPVNQKIDLFVMVKQDEFLNAMKELGANAFKIWCYMAKNKDSYKEKLSSKYAMELCGIGKTAYNNGIKELKQKGYLIDDNKNHKKDDTTNYWIFYATPHNFDTTIYKDNDIPFSPAETKRIEELFKNNDDDGIEWN